MDIEELFTDPAELASLSPEQRIVYATLKCIEEHGLAGTTVREIAAKAGQNPAAVNYYYRSKDRLIEIALRQAWIDTEKDFQKLLDTYRDGRALGEMATRYLIEGAKRSPKIIRAIIVENPALRMESAAFFKKIFEEIYERSGPGLGKGIGSVLLVSLMILIGFAPDSIEALADIDMDNPADLDTLARRLAAGLFGPAPESPAKS
jgi:AcrR family transcriptional regulator